MGTGEAVWYGIHLFFVEGKDEDYEYDEYGTSALWTRVHGAPCRHRWQYRTRIGFLLVPYRTGAEYKGHTRDSVNQGLYWLSTVEKEWARISWDRLVFGSGAGYAEARAALNELGNTDLFGDPAPREVAVRKWWDQHRHLFE